MGRKGIEILNIDVEKLLTLLNKALSEEWLAYYQYWLGARVIKGPSRDEVAAELQAHAQEELHHAELLAKRIIQLGGTPVLSPSGWLEMADCKYYPPQDRCMGKILQENLKGERCAIQRYEDIANFTQGIDFATFNLATFILTEELEHEDDLESWLEDLRLTNPSKDCDCYTTIDDTSCQCGCNDLPATTDCECKEDKDSNCECKENTPNNCGCK